MKDGWSDHRQSVNVLFRNIFVTGDSLDQPQFVIKLLLRAFAREVASDQHRSVIEPPRNQFARGMSSNLLHSVFKLIFKGFAKEIFADQPQSGSKPTREGPGKKTALVQLQVLPKLIQRIWEICSD